MNKPKVSNKIKPTVIIYPSQPDYITDKKLAPYFMLSLCLYILYAIHNPNSPVLAEYYNFASGKVR